MSEPLICPACQRQQVTTITCPNCETDLAALRILATLPPVQKGLDRWWGWAMMTVIGSFIGGLLAANIPL
jgi:hypothetical protein